jgi:mycolipenoyl-CoA---2-(long-chain-fatty acyl)-trehalose mycolipenoyltransferase / long-chain-acyl-CoA---trehalose acyltransferase
MMEFYMMHVAVTANSAPIRLPQRIYNDFRTRKHGYTSARKLESPQVGAWIGLAENNNGSFPDFRLGNPYLAAMKSVYVHFAQGCSAVRLRNVDHG